MCINRNRNGEMETQQKDFVRIRRFVTFYFWSPVFFHNRPLFFFFFLFRWLFICREERDGGNFSISANRYLFGKSWDNITWNGLPVHRLFLFECRRSEFDRVDKVLLNPFGADIFWFFFLLLILLYRYLFAVAKCDFTSMQYALLCSL